MNRAELTGWLTNDIKLHHTKKNDTAVTTFVMAVDRPFTNKDGKRGTDFPVITVWGKPAETLSKYAGKGSQIGISGRTQTRTYQDKDDKTVYVQEIVADSNGMELIKTGKSSGKGSDMPNSIGNKVDGIGDKDNDLPF